MRASIPDAALTAFKEGLRGRVAVQGSAEYEEARPIWNAMEWIVFRPVPVFRSRSCPPGLFLLPLPHAVNRIVRRDSIDPGTKIRSPRKLPQLLIPTQKCLLHHLFGIVPIPGHAVSQTENVVAVPLNKNAIRIAIARERALHGNGVALCDGLSAIDARLHPIH